MIISREQAITELTATYGAQYAQYAVDTILPGGEKVSDHRTGVRYYEDPDIREGITRVAPSGHRLRRIEAARRASGEL